MKENFTSQKSGESFLYPHLSLLTCYLFLARHAKPTFPSLCLPSVSLSFNSYKAVPRKGHAESLLICIHMRSEQKEKRSSERFRTMEIKVRSDPQNHDESKHLLLRDGAEKEEKTPIQKAISQTFQSTAHLANLLPTGSVLAFQLLSPIFTNEGNCDSVGRSMTATLVTLCGVSCFLLCFTDSFKDKKGNVCYGFATLQGLWVIDGTAKLPPELAAKYRLRFIDFMHAFLSILVFAAVALFDKSVVSCFFPVPSYRTQEILTRLPIGIGVLCSMLFVVFPTKRHGIGFPLSVN